MTLEEKIRELRHKLRMSQRELAELVGCNQSWISALEAGTKRPSYDLLLRLDKVAKKYKTKLKLAL